MKPDLAGNFDYQSLAARANSPFFAALFLLLLFCILVGTGMTGSSLGLGLSQDSEPVQADTKRLFGVNRPIRSDEWLVFTPMAIAQVNHSPSFPVVNKNLGPDGQNMLVVGMTGVPVVHISQIAKPATWGFFVFDLRRALAWYWWLPVFGAIFAIWGVMNILLPGRWAIGLVTSGIFVMSGYVAAWSNWPAYAAMFPAIAFCIFFKMLEPTQIRSWWRSLVLGAVLGGALAGFVLVLYPPMQIPLGYLFLFLTVAVVVRDRLWSTMDAAKALGLLLAAAIAGLICWVWWMDAKSAIEAVQATIYPGQRTAVPGGGMMGWQALKGFLNHHSLHYEKATLTNQSESASFFYFYPLVFATLAVQAFRRQLPSVIQIALVAFCVLVLCFQFVGIGSFLSELSLWGRVPLRRADVSLGLASILLCSIALAEGANRKILPQPGAVIISLLWTLMVVAVTKATPEGAIGQLNSAVWLLLAVIVFVISYWFLTGNIKAFLLGNFFLVCSISLPFNPLVKAPTELTLVGHELQTAKQSRHRVLSAVSQIDAMMLAAAGVPVANGVFYYPQQSIWKNLDPKGENNKVTNRYQHLIYLSDESGILSGYRIESPQADVVMVKFDPAKFDFRLTSAQIVLAPTGQILSANPYLVLMEKGATRSLYYVK